MNIFSACHLDENNYMRASSLRDCLIKLGSPARNPVQFIELTYEPYEDNLYYLDNVCNAIAPGATLDRVRTKAQPDVCHGHSGIPAQSGKAFMYPSYCTDGWLHCTGKLNDCSNPNYDGFYCKS